MLIKTNANNTVTPCYLSSYGASYSLTPSRSKKNKTVGQKSGCEVQNHTTRIKTTLWELGLHYENRNHTTRIDIAVLWIHSCQLEVKALLSIATSWQDSSPVFLWTFASLKIIISTWSRYKFVRSQKSFTMTAENPEKWFSGKWIAREVNSPHRKVELHVSSSSWFWSLDWRSWQQQEKEVS